MLTQKANFSTNNSKGVLKKGINIFIQQYTMTLDSPEKFTIPIA